MNQDTKRAIKELVLDLRGLLEDDLALVLKRYGILTDRPWLEPGAIQEHGEAHQSTRLRLEAAMRPEIERGATLEKAAQLYVREAGFTHLNRLVGLKVLEVRELIPEVIQTRPEYGGRSLFHRDYRAFNPKEAEAADDGLPGALKAMCSNVSEQIRFVFDVDSDSSTLWPRYAALKGAIEKINALPNEVWSEDEIIGWIYQFYNANEKEEIRERGKPKLPIEVAVINQFFTPRWVVKYLVDNTLGRLWLEMHPDSERVRIKCNYLVPELLSMDDANPREERGFKLDPDSPINNPGAAPRREVKPPQELRLIDPACGTMHFGHYAFEVFQEIYRDAREHGWVEPEDAIAETEIPLAILHYNLYGVDIDLRAVQLAAVSLFVKARTAQRAAGVSDAEAARLPWQVNLVSADAHLTNGTMRDRFLERYSDDPKLQQVWKELFSEMEDIAQVGSLLRVEERFQQLLTEYRPPSVKGFNAEAEQENLPGIAQSARQMHLGDDQGGLEGWNPGRTISQMLLALRSFAKTALTEHDVNAEVFASEAKKALGLLDVLMQEYDVVAMNPPYGYSTPEADEYLKELEIPHKDLYAAFVAVSLQLAPRGYSGAFISRTFMFLPTFEDFRMQILYRRAKVACFVEAGLGVLDDATVRPVALVLDSSTSRESAAYFNLTDASTDLKREELEARIGELWNGAAPMAKGLHIWKSKDLSEIPKTILAYTLPEEMVACLIDNPPLDRDLANLPDLEKIASVKVGLSTGDDARFRRYWWEIAEKQSAPAGWVEFRSGGTFSRYYTRTESLLDWREDGRRLKDFNGSAIRNEHHYYREAVELPYISELGIGASYMPEGCIFGHASRVVFPEDQELVWPLVALLNSELMDFTINALTPDRKHEASLIGSLPIVHPPKDIANRLGLLAQSAFDMKASWDEGDELSMRFRRPWLLDESIYDPKSPENESGNEPVQEGESALKRIAADVEGRPKAELANRLHQLTHHEEALDKELSQMQSTINGAVYSLYGLSEATVNGIKATHGGGREEVVWPDMYGETAAEKRREHVRRLISYLIKQELNQSDGIQVVAGLENNNIMNAIRERIEDEFGERGAIETESEIAKILGRPLKDWIDGPFIKWHTKRYKRRPIIWHVSSRKNTFGCFLLYQRTSRDTVTRVRTVYLWRLRDRFDSELEAAMADEKLDKATDLESRIDELDELDMKLEGILTSGWELDIDAGVKANILPLQKAGVLRYKNLV